MEAEGTVFILVNTVDASTDAPIDAGSMCPDSKTSAEQNGYNNLHDLFSHQD